MSDTKSGIYRTPDGKGKQKCIEWDDWVKYKYTKPELYWEEEHVVKIFPDGVDEVITTED